jgi:hypothetical protein
MDEEIRNIYMCTGFSLPGMSNKEFDNISKKISIQEDK